MQELAALSCTSVPGLQKQQGTTLPPARELGNPFELQLFLTLGFFLGLNQHSTPVGVTPLSTPLTGLELTSP